MLNQSNVGNVSEGEQPIFLKAREAAQVLNVSQRKLSTLRKDKEIPFIRISARTIRYDRQALQKWMRDKSSN